MYFTLPHTALTRLLNEPSNRLSVVNLGVPVLPSKKPVIEFYSVDYPSLSQCLHFSDPDKPADAKAVITKMISFSPVPWNIPGTDKVAMVGVLRTNNPAIIEALEAQREQEVINGGPPSVLTLGEMRERVEGQVSRQIREAAAKFGQRDNALIAKAMRAAAEAEDKNTALRLEMDKMQRELAALRQGVPVEQIPRAKPNVDLPVEGMDESTDTDFEESLEMKGEVDEHDAAEHVFDSKADPTVGKASEEVTDEDQEEIARLAAEAKAMKLKRQAAKKKAGR